MTEASHVSHSLRRGSTSALVSSLIPATPPILSQQLSVVPASNSNQPTAKCPTKAVKEATPRRPQSAASTGPRTRPASSNGRIQRPASNNPPVSTAQESTAREPLVKHLRQDPKTTEPLSASSAPGTGADTTSAPVRKSPQARAPAPASIGDREVDELLELFSAYPESPAKVLQQLRLFDQNSVPTLRTFLANVRFEQSSFRSLRVFCELLFTRTKSFVAQWPTPNSFRTCVALGCLEQFSLSLDQHNRQFLADLIEELTLSIYGNQSVALSSPLRTDNVDIVARFLELFDKGKPWFEECKNQLEHIASLRRSNSSMKETVTRLEESLQKSRSRQITQAFQTAVAHHKNNAQNAELEEALNQFKLKDFLAGSASTRKKLLAEYLCAQDSTSLSWRQEDLTNYFRSLPSKDALELLSRLLHEVSVMNIPQTGEVLAMGVDGLRAAERRQFLHEYFLLVNADELQEALEHRDEANEDKRWKFFLEEMKDTLKLNDMLSCGTFATGTIGTGSASAKEQQQQEQETRFHTDEARVCARVHELVAIVEAIASEVNVHAHDMAPSASSIDTKLSKGTVERLEMFVNPALCIARKKQLEELVKQQEALANAASEVASKASSCTGDGKCTCEKHRQLDALLDPASCSVTFAVLDDPSLEVEMIAEANDESDGDDDEDDEDGEDLDDDDDSPPSGAGRVRPTRSPNTARPPNASMCRPSSAPASIKRTKGTGKQRKKPIPRKRAHNKLSSLRNQRLFSLQEVCVLTSSILQLKFARDAAIFLYSSYSSSAALSTSSGAPAAAAASSLAGSMAASAIGPTPHWNDPYLEGEKEKRFGFCIKNRKQKLLRTLTRDYLLRKYGIKSIATMYGVQLDRSLVHHAFEGGRGSTSTASTSSAIPTSTTANNPSGTGTTTTGRSNIRSELFAWFMGVDTKKSASKEYAFDFYQQLIKAILGAMVKTPFWSLPSHVQVALYNEYIGDGDVCVSVNTTLVVNPTVTATDNKLSGSAAIGSIGTSSGGAQPAPLSLGAVMSGATSSGGAGAGVGAGSSSSTFGIRQLTAPQALEACERAFPPKMKQMLAYESFMRNNLRNVPSSVTWEMERFLKTTMELWRTIFDSSLLKLTALVDASIQSCTNDAASSSNNNGNNNHSSPGDTFKKKPKSSDEEVPLQAIKSVMSQYVPEITSGECEELREFLIQDRETLTKSRLLQFILETQLLKRDDPPPVSSQTTTAASLVSPSTSFSTASTAVLTSLLTGKRSNQGFCF